MNEEYNSIMRNKPWDLVELPKDKVPIGSKWLFKYRRKADGSIETFKARLGSNYYFMYTVFSLVTPLSFS